MPSSCFDLQSLIRKAFHGFWIPCSHNFNLGQGSFNLPHVFTCQVHIYGSQVLLQPFNLGLI